MWQESKKRILMVSDIKGVIYVEVNLYDADSFTTLWTGRASDIPQEYDSRIVRIINSGGAENELDIGIGGGAV